MPLKYVLKFGDIRKFQNQRNYVYIYLQHKCEIRFVIWLKNLQQYRRYGYQNITFHDLVGPGSKELYMDVMIVLENIHEDQKLSLTGHTLRKIPKILPECPWTGIRTVPKEEAEYLELIHAKKA